MKVCSNCYTGCVDITSDKCVKYTGIDVPLLGIRNGDSISYVNGALITFLSSTLNGTGIKFELYKDNLCDIVKDSLPDCEDITIVHITNALSKAICTLQSFIEENRQDIDTIEANYQPGCLADGIDGSEGTHEVLQAVIHKLCQLSQEISGLELDLHTNYVKISDINDYISNYISQDAGTVTGHKTKMIPFTVMEYYGSLSHFDSTGAGTGEWEEIYLCNGNNGTPDKRGRIPVGVTNGMGGGGFPVATDPTVSGNPTYNIMSTNGTNTVTLIQSQIPSHSHTADISIPPHSHTYSKSIPGRGYETQSDDNPHGGYVTATTSEYPGLDIDIVTTEVGGNRPHSNIPPVLACYYIMYIPS